jgi:DNA-binding GntR family transcriptional regulator
LRRTLHDEVVGRIRDMIIEGTLEPGARVHEGQLGEALGISRTPLREALKYLASEGLLDLVAGRGAVVRRLSPKDVHDMLVVLSAMEALAGRLVCANADDAEIASIRALHERMLEFYEKRQRLDYYKYNQMIHSAIVELSGNAFLASIHASAQARLKRIRFLGNAAPEKWDAAVAEHKAMMEALDRRDGDALAAVLSHHLDETWVRVKDSL